MSLRIGNDIIPYTQLEPDMPGRGYDTISSGYIRLNDPGIDYFRKSGQLTGPYANVRTPEDYYKVQFGGGEVVTGSDGQKYFRPPNGEFNVVNQPLNYNPADTAWDQMGLYAIGGLVGLGALGGLGAGAGALDGAVAGAGAGTGFEVGAGSGFLEGIGGAGAGELGAGGFSLDYLNSNEFLSDFDFGSASQSDITGALEQAGMNPQQAGSVAQELSQLTPQQASSIDWGNLDWGKLLSAGGSIISNLTGPNAEDFQNAANMADPFASQRGQYQAMLPGALQGLQGNQKRFENQFNRFNKRYNRKYDQFQDRYNQEYNQFENRYNRQHEDYLRDYQREYNQFERGYNNQYRDFRGTLDQMFTDPDYWENDSLLAGMNENSVNATEREMAARGYNMSGNEMQEISNVLYGNSADYASQQQQNYTNYAGNFLNSYGQTGLGRLNNFSSSRLGALDDYSDTGLGRLNNFSNTGIASLNNFSTTGLNQQSNYLNYLNNQLGTVNTIGNFAGANVSDPSRAAYLSQLGLQNSQNQWNDMWGNVGVLANSFFGGGSGGTYEGST